MDAKLVREVQECLQGERTLFHYFPDQYAIYLLSRVVSENKRVAIRELRSSQLASLLNRPIIKSMLQQCGDGYLTQKVLEDYWHDKTESFVLTLGEWGGDPDWTWDQVSRPGKNLVLQLNASNKWARQLQGVLKEPANKFFDSGHPVSATRALTLAWVRLDIDFDTDEALIEEVQSDSIRDIAKLYRRAGLALSKGRPVYRYYGLELDAQKTVDAAGAFLDGFKKTWQEAMLTAAVSFVFEELGVKNLYYHSFETGNEMKNLSWCYPPRSLYTELPKKFCFTPRAEAPAFLQREKKIKRKLKKLDGGSWFYMAA